MILDRRSACLCCGPSAVQHSRIDNYIASNGHDHEAGEGEEAWVVCNNPACGKWQSFSCAMDFCNRVIDSVPRAAYSANKWVQGMLPFYYEDEAVPPSNRIHVEHCMACVLSSTIPPSTKPSLEKLPIPTPLTTCTQASGRVAAGVASDSRTEHLPALDPASDSDSEWEDCSDEGSLPGDLASISSDSSDESTASTQSRS